MSAPFWMVVGVSADGELIGPPLRRHDSLVSAETEAKRLSSIAISKTFFVLQSISGFTTPKPEPERVIAEPRADDDEARAEQWEQRRWKPSVDLKVIDEPFGELPTDVQELLRHHAEQGGKVEYRYRGQWFLSVFSPSWQPQTCYRAAHEKAEPLRLLPEVDTAPAPAPLKLEVGKRYIRRDGAISGPVHCHSNNDHFFLCDGRSYTADGRYLPFRESEHDLIAEAPEGAI